MTIRKLLCLTAVCLSFTEANATDFYLGARAGISLFDGTADSDGLQPPPQGGLPEEIPIDGLSFDSNETAWGLFAGWQLRDWFALEAGHTDLGESRRNVPTSIVGEDLIFLNSTSIAIEEWYVSARFSKDLSKRFSANWTLGASRASFDVAGSIPVFVGPVIGPGLIPQRLPFATPGDEIGLVWGFGFDWLLTQRLVLGIDYRQHNTNVLDVQSLTLGLRVRL
ncbi:MAG: outer membrane beta-barrel protein [Pseudomonadota bacterium]